MVHGRVRVDVWEREGQPPSVTCVVDASFVGHDLSKGTSRFLRVSRQERTNAPEDSEEVRSWCTATTPTGRSSTRRAQPREAPAA